MLHGRRLSIFLFLAVVAFPFVGLELFGQKDEKKDAKKPEDKKPEPKKEAPKDPTKVILAWKFEKGKAFYQTMKTKHHADHEGHEQ